MKIYQCGLSVLPMKLKGTSTNTFTATMGTNCQGEVFVGKGDTNEIFVGSELSNSPTYSYISQIAISRVSFSISGDTATPSLSWMFHNNFYNSY